MQNRRTQIAADTSARLMDIVSNMLDEENPDINHISALSFQALSFVSDVIQFVQVTQKNMKKDPQDQ